MALFVCISCFIFFNLAYAILVEAFEGKRRSLVVEISEKQVAHIASLARLKLTHTETESYTTQLNQILQFAEKLNELDTEGIGPTSHAVVMNNVLREDVIQPSLPREEVLLNAPEQQEGMFKVPAIFQE